MSKLTIIKMSRRKVPYSILIKLIKNKRPYSILGFTFVFCSIFVLLPCAILLVNLQTESYNKYDFDNIDRHGVEKIAKILDIRPIYNVTINGEHPLRIRYEYLKDGKAKIDQFQTVNLDKINNVKIGNKIVVKTLGNESKIKDLDPYVFPYYIYYLFPLFFLLLGLPFFLYGLIPALNEYNLYRSGIAKKGKIISLIDDSNSLMTNTRQRFLVGYCYLNSIGEKIFGESKISDLVVIKKIKVDDTINLFISEADETKSCIVSNYDIMKNNWEI